MRIPEGPQKNFQMAFKSVHPRTIYASAATTSYPLREGCWISCLRGKRERHNGLKVSSTYKAKYNISF